MQISFKSNIQSIIKDIDKIQKNFPKEKKEVLSKVCQAGFQQVADKYIVQGSFENSKGKYTTPPGANIQAKIVVAFNPKTLWKKIKEVPMFVRGKVVDRSGKYLRQIQELATKDFSKGTVKVDDIKVDVSENSVKVYAVTGSETWALEKRKQAGKTPIKPIFKSFRSAVNLWSKFFKGKTK